jgi:hypothetical protein
MSTGLRRVPPLACPIVEGLQRLNERARKGDVQAAQRIRDIAQHCQRIIENLPAKITKKSCDPLIPSNALAIRLLERLRLIKDYSRIGSELGVAIKALPPLNPKSFPSWWRCAWAITKDVNFCDDEMNTLIDKIGMKAPSVQKKFQARKNKLIMIAQEKDKLAPGIDWINIPALCKKFTRQADTASNEWRKYVAKQTKKAALRIWFQN